MRGERVWACRLKHYVPMNPKVRTFRQETAKINFFVAYLHVYFLLYYAILHSTFGRLTIFLPFFYLFFYEYRQIAANLNTFGTPCAPSVENSSLPRESVETTAGNVKWRKLIAPTPFVLQRLVSSNNCLSANELPHAIPLASYKTL